MSLNKYWTWSYRPTLGKSSRDEHHSPTRFLWNPTGIAAFLTSFQQNLIASYFVRDGMDSVLVHPTYFSSLTFYLHIFMYVRGWIRGWVRLGRQRLEKMEYIYECSSLIAAVVDDDPRVTWEGKEKKKTSSWRELVGEKEMEISWQVPSPSDLYPSHQHTLIFIAFFCLWTRTRRNHFIPINKTLKGLKNSDIKFE